ncbi:hypothetical protein [Enterococcus saccharolyticus]|uniref:Uncharacterized protein n=1 Tax=Enterococcus saccharolyticus subsp. saccharolyticus ATCC 43076 TaxID=1139996 RepID=S0JAR4_9ENTE|nr:hypothetical protein [Enterococcus saccharolyticus]EOT29382.1 hypothetical protein OMQ_01334 [Enterococcus saccharolyticus subsp. saccharolyticus ATCC 43076]EOT81180.1 hypothetical protein I572_01712 [Enterococcus saccharolyticus subsp. saccharolyticus ATCC 43076]
MEESVFFNKGNAISSTVDLKNLYETAQIEKYRGLNEKLVIVQKKNGAEYMLFNQTDFDQLTDREEYQIVEHI